MILSCGEALIDMLPQKTVEGATGFVPFAGGSVFNSAIALGRLGVPSSFFSGLSSDFFGQILRDSLQQAQVKTDLCAIADLPSTLAFVRFEEGQARYDFYDENTAGRMLSQTQLPQLDDTISALLFGGISLISEPCGSTYEALMSRETSKRIIMLDPNIRPNFIQDQPKHHARMLRMIANADIVKVSDEDMLWFAPDQDPVVTAKIWLQAPQSGPKLVIITKGADGADAYTIRHHISVPGIKVTVADTVGAGDTVNAGVLASLYQQGLLQKQRIADLNEQQIRTCLSYGIQAAAITVSRAGANPPWQHEMPANH